MCVNNKLAQKEFRRKGGIEILKNNLVYQKVLDQIGNQKIFIMVVLDCLWNSIIGNKRNEEQFIDMDGLFTIFELLEQSDNIHIKIILSCIASLVDNKRSSQYFIQWKSNYNSNIDATKLLINIYREEDEKYGVKYDNGILKMLDRPINPNTSYLIRKKLMKEELDKKNKILRSNKKMTNTETSSLLNTYDSNFTNTDLTGFSSDRNSNRPDLNIYRSENFIESYLSHRIIEITKEFDLRETIFSIFYRAGFNYINNHISLNTPEDKQTFVMIKNYPIFKNLENWKDVVEELDDLQIKPILDDNNMIMTHIEESTEKLNLAIRQQETIYEIIKKNQQDDLRDYFKKIEDFSKLKLENQKLKDKENS